MKFLNFPGLCPGPLVGLQRPPDPQLFELATRASRAPNVCLAELGASPTYEKILATPLD